MWKDWSLLWSVFEGTCSFLQVQIFSDCVWSSYRLPIVMFWGDHSSYRSTVFKECWRDVNSSLNVVSQNELLFRLGRECISRSGKTIPKHFVHKTSHIQGNVQIPLSHFPNTIFDFLPKQKDLDLDFVNVLFSYEYVFFCEATNLCILHFLSGLPNNQDQMKAAR